MFEVKDFCDVEYEYMCNLVEQKLFSTGMLCDFVSIAIDYFLM